MSKSNDKIVKVAVESGPWAWALFAAYIGAVIYFFQFDTSVWGFLVALVKAAFWPAYVLFEILGSLGIK